MRLRGARGLVALTGGSLLAALLATACASLAPEPGHDSALGGRWSLDPAASGDFDATLSRMLAEHQEKMRRERREREAGPEAGEPGSARDAESQARPIRVPDEPAERVRARLGEALRPPLQLLIELGAGTVSMKADDEPARVFYPGQRVGRIDIGGSARVDTGWSGSTFVVQQKYTSGATRLQRYTSQGDSLVAELKYSDPFSGAFELRSVYRRQ
jgi:hypothetical protein